ncbi:hypothetical protein LNJ08_12585 [Tenacibaculum finnmarkense genomovar ulcerans]|uniref:hypothetical protein n=1 Tax=Tenacibaculum finnmarkense TaxID=2781243 RepID=UPI001E2A2CB2|nr:hypothetical protein [Tenacibaculum finnmarkense]MCD8403701.1 hypothetical protein [Tenacibaculum finnmarkense genomovar finnmarkense]MCD8455228.1 hypothetical protein [Tenacibaculum finnmarkense genomovar ulcerans]
MKYILILISLIFFNCEKENSENKETFTNNEIEAKCEKFQFDSDCLKNIYFNKKYQFNIPCKYRYLENIGDDSVSFKIDSEEQNIIITDGNGLGSSSSEGRIKLDVLKESITIGSLGKPLNNKFILEKGNKIIAVFYYTLDLPFKFRNSGGVVFVKQENSYVEAFGTIFDDDRECEVIRILQNVKILE